MKKTVLLGGLLVIAGAAVVFSLMRKPLTPKPRNQATGMTRGSPPVAPARTVRPPGKAGLAARPHRPGPPLRKDTVSARRSAPGPGNGAGARQEPEAGKKPAAVIATVATDPGAVAATVNGQPVRMTDVMPPGVLETGARLPEGTYKAFVDQAVNASLLVQAAREMGIADDEDMARISENMRSELADVADDESPKEINWEVKHFTRTAVINELFRKEGLTAKMVGKDEVQEYYDGHSDEYDWLRKREAARGVTNPEQIERRVKEQIRQDLMLPRAKEARKKQKAYIKTLRDDADINLAN